MAKANNGSAVTSTKAGVTTYTLTGGNGVDNIDASDYFTAPNSSTNRFVIGAGNGDDTVVGSDRDELINGDGDDGNGADTLYGGGGKDEIHGGNGADVIQGDAGADLLYGEKGGDRFVYTQVSDSLNDNTNYDTIQDFTSGSDKLDLGAVPLTGAGHPPELQWTGASPGAWGVWYTGGFVYADTNGDGGADMKIKLTGAPSLVYGDFLGINSGPKAVADSFTVAEGSSLSGATVAAGDSDPDGDTLSYTLNTPAPAGVSIASNGAVTFTASKAAYGHLAAGASQTVSGSYTVSDGHGGTATANFSIKITGVNDTASIAGTATGDLTEDNAATVATGALTVSDIDDGQAKAVAQTNVAGTYGKFSVTDAGAWTYTLDNADPDTNALKAGQTVTDKFTVASLDGTATQEVVVTVHGANDAASMSGDTAGSVTEDNAANTATGTLTVTDPDTGENKAAVQTNVAGTYGKFSVLDTGAWTYTLDNADPDTNALKAGDSKTETFTVYSLDGSASKDVVVTVNGANDAASFTGDKTGGVTEDNAANTATGALTVVDPDAGENKAVAQTDSAGTYGKFSITEAGAWTYTLDNANPATNALKGGQTVTETFSVASLDGSASQDVVVTVTGANDAASIAGDTTGDLTEDSATTVATGVLTVTDPDAGEAKAAAQTDVGTTYGKFSVTDAGAWTYTLDNSKAATNALKAGQTVTDKFTVASLDGTASKEVSVTVHGANDAASMSGDTTGSVTEDNAATTATGTLTVTDPDSGENKAAVQTNVAGTYGTFSVADTGAWTYTLDNSKAATDALKAGDNPTETFTVYSADGTAHQDVVVTVHGANDKASFSGATTGGVTEDNATTTATGTLTVVDPDAGENKAVPQTNVAGAYGQFSILDTGAWTYTLDNANPATNALKAGDNPTETFTVASFDGSASQTVIITVHGANDPASIAGAATGGVTEDNATTTATGTLTVTDPDAGENKAVAQTNVAGTYGTFSILDTGAWTYTLDNADPDTNALKAAQTATDKFTVVSLDGSASQDVTITVTGANDTASITGATTGEVTEDNATATATGALTVTDPDSGENQAIAQTNAAGTYGTFSVTTGGAWTYTLDNSKAATNALNTGEDKTDSFTVKSADNSASKVVTITVHGHSDYTSPPVFTGTGDPNDFDNLGTAGDQNSGAFSTTNGPDLLYGGAGNDVINGNNGADTIYGGSGNDTIQGNNDNDVLYGGSGNDTILGSNNDDRLVGGYGADNLTGGSGADTFVYLSKNDTGDTISDFVQGTDKIEFKGLGLSAAGFLSTQLSSPGAVGAHQFGFIQSGGVTHIYVDTDGVAGADLEIHLTGTINLAASDFLFT